MQDAVEAACPGLFVVDAAGDAQVAEVHFVLPAAGEQALVQEVAIAQVAQAFAHAHVQPDARARAGFVEDGLGTRRGAIAQERRKNAGPCRVFRADAGEDLAAVPPDGGREDAELAEDLRVVQADGQGDEPPERRAGQACAGRALEGAERAVDQGLELVDQKPGVEGTFAAAVAPVAAGGVLVHAAMAGVVDADQDDGFDQALAEEAIGGGVRAPGTSGNVGGTRVKEVLAVVEVENGETVGRLGAVGGRQPDGDVAVVGQVGRMKVGEAAQARVAVEIVGVFEAPKAGGIPFGLRAVEGQMLRRRRCLGGGKGGLIVICQQASGTQEILNGDAPGGRGSGYQRIDA